MSEKTIAWPVIVQGPFGPMVGYAECPFTTECKFKGDGTISYKVTVHNPYERAADETKARGGE